MSKRQIIGMGETILDIIFQGIQPVAAVPGGSSFNSIISIGRAGVPCTFVGYTGDDRVGAQTHDFLLENGVGTRYFEIRHGERSAVSLAFLDGNGDAQYVFYKEPPHVSPSWKVPPMAAHDIMLFGSYYAACTGMRPQVMQMLEQAQAKGVMVYYDLNFRKSHAHELESLMPVIRSNFRQSTFVRGSADDFDVMYGLRDARQIYEQHISAYCPYFICTAGAELVTVCTPTGIHYYDVPGVDQIVSTVGAGDNFNAGFACALIWLGVTQAQLPALQREEWGRIIHIATSFAAEACKSAHNYISHEFGKRLREQYAEE